MLTAIDIDNPAVLKWLCKRANSIYHSSSLPELPELPLKSQSITFHDQNNSVVAVADVYDSIDTVLVTCKGSQTISDWISNFLEFPTTSNDKSIPDFIHENAVKISQKFSHRHPDIFNNKKVVCCGHSRGAGIASYLGYYIASNSINCQVSVMTFCSIPYATDQFKTDFNNVVYKARNIISILDPLQALWVSRSIPGQTRILEFTYPGESLLALFTVPLTAFVEEIHILFDRIFHLQGISEIMESAASFVLFKSTKQFTSFSSLVAMFVLNVGINVFQGTCHKMDYTEHVVGGGIEPLIESIFELLADVNNKATNLVSLITKFVMGPLFEFLKKVFVNVVGLIDELWIKLKEFVGEAVNFCKINLSLISYPISIFK